MNHLKGRYLQKNIMLVGESSRLIFELTAIGPICIMLLTAMGSLWILSHKKHHDYVQLITS